MSAAFRFKGCVIGILELKTHLRHSASWAGAICGTRNCRISNDRFGSITANSTTYDNFSVCRQSSLPKTETDKAVTRPFSLAYATLRSTERAKERSEYGDF